MAELTKTDKKMQEEREAIIKEMEKREKMKKAAKSGKRVHIEDALITLHFRSTFIEPTLGSQPGSQQIQSDFIASKSPNAISRDEEIALYGAESVDDSLTTRFYQEEVDGSIVRYLLTYQYEGFIKSAAGAMKRGGLLNIPAYKSVINQLVFVSASETLPIQRKIILQLPDGGSADLNQRSLRASTPKGERTALASSEQLPAGTCFEYYIRLLDKSFVQTLLSWIEYGKVCGIGQWRNAGYGRFVTEIKLADEWIPIEMVDKI